MDAEPEFIRYLCDQLRGWGPVQIRRMFGGHGVFRSGVMFALIHAETLYLRSDAATQGDFTALGMEPFGYRRGGRHVALGYHQAPPDALDDRDVLAEWADKAYAAALRHARKPAKSRKR